MIAEGQRGNLGEEDEARDQFPVGMRVLAVDDDPICLKVLENLLRKCRYHVTTTNQAITALKMLRENRNNFDLVISDVNMPDMDGFKLLEHVGLEMDLPVIMLSAHSDTKLVMKGVTHGACDYLLKPVRLEELKNIWQHVVRRKKFDCKDQNRPPNDDRNRGIGGEGSQGIASENNVDQAKIMGKKRKDQIDDEEEGEENGEENEDPSAQKKPRVVWSVELHRKFVTAVHQLGLEKAVPKKILDLMNVEGLTRENVASHLQKYRLYLKKATHQANINASFGNDPSYLRMGSLDGFGDFRSLSGSGRVSSTSLSAYASSGMFSRLNSPAGLSIRGISSSSLIRAGQNQNMNSSISTLGNIQPSMLPANQSSNFYQGIPTSVELNQSQQSNRTANISQINPIDNSSGFTVGTSFPDNRVSLNNSVSGVSNSQLMLHGTSQQAPNTGTFRNQSFLRGASSAESFDIGGSSNLLDYSRCNESWQGAAQLSRFPSNTLPLSETFSSDQLPPSSLIISSTNPHIGNNAVDFSSPSANAVPLDNARGELQCQEGLIGNVVQASTYTQQQGWEEHKQDYNQTMNRSFNSINPLFSTNDVPSSMMQSSNHNNNAMYSKRADTSHVGQLNGVAPSLTQHIEIEKFSSDTRMKPNEAYILELMKCQDNFIQNNYGSLDDMSGMVKREHEVLLMDAEIGFESYPIGSCI